MIKLKNTPQKLLTVGFIGIEIAYRSDAKEWLLSLIEENDYYGEHGPTLFVRIESIETMLRLKFSDFTGKVYRHKNDWPKRNFAIATLNTHRYKHRGAVNSSKSTFTRSKISGKKKKHWVKKKYLDRSTCNWGQYDCS